VVKIGERYGKLLVIDIVDNPRERGDTKLFKCLCDCGKTTITRKYSLHSGHAKSCSCIISESLYRGVKDLSLEFFNSYKKDAEKRKISFNLTIDEAFDIFTKQNSKCALTGLDIKFNKNNKLRTASLDRINSNLGYFKGNVQWTHKIANKIKMDWQESEMFDVLAIMFADDCSNENFVNINYIHPYFLRRAFYRSKKFRREFSVEDKDVLNLYNKQKGRCALSKVPFIICHKGSKRTKNNLSIDRIDSKKGYTVDNIQLVDKNINKSKGTLSNSEFLHWCRLIYEYQKSIRNI